MYPHNPVCRKCEVELKPEKNGVWLEDLASFGSYKLWQADLWKCPICGIEIVIGFGEKAKEHFEEDYKTQIESIKADSKELMIQCKE